LFFFGFEIRPPPLTILAQRPSGGQRYFSGAVFSGCDGFSGLICSGLADPSTTTGSPGRYSGASLTWSRVRFRTTWSTAPLGGKLRAPQSTAIFRLPTPRNPPKSMTAARTWPSRLTITSIILPMSSPAVERTLLPRMPSTSRSSITVAGVPSPVIDGASWPAPLDGTCGAVPDGWSADSANRHVSAVAWQGAAFDWRTSGAAGTETS